jgi:hypothetical protein
MKLERYKSIRNKPKNTSTLSRSKKQMLAKPKPSSSTAAPKLRQIYSTRIEWATKTIPALKEK